MIKEKTICFYSVTHPMFRIGGSEVQTYLYAKEFSKRGWRVIFLSPDKKNNRVQLRQQRNRSCFIQHLKNIHSQLANRVVAIF